jgi:alcohol dehydrogenase
MSETELFLPCHSAIRLISGQDAFSELTKISQGLRVLIITSKGFTQRGIIYRLQQHLSEASKIILYDAITPNPELEQLEELTIQLRHENPELLIALGGGSVLDAGKVLAQTLVQEPSSEKVLNKHLRQKQPFQWLSPIPLITIPTTAGTGAEVTPFATIWDQRTFTKYSLADPSMYPAFVVLQPELTLSLPKRITLHTALDTISHSLETLWNKYSTETSQAYAEQALKLVVENLNKVLQQSQSLPERARLQQASYFAGLAISVNRTAIAHSISYPLTSHHQVPHGLACSFSLPAIIELVLTESSLPEHQRQFLVKVSAWLLELPIFAELNRYVSWPEIYALIPEMFSPGRADNFILPSDESCIRAILLRSEQLAQEYKL